MSESWAELSPHDLKLALGIHGWYTRAVWDICWLDCPEPGYLLLSKSRGICLCLRHAAVLQAGCWDGDYSGAPLPPESCATAWPWQPLTSGIAA